MLQRKQTIYFLLAGIISIVLIFAPLAVLNFKGQEYLFTVSGIKSVSPGTTLGISTVPLLIILTIVAGINIIVIFLYKSRKFQMKLSILNMNFILGLSTLIVFHLVNISASEIAYSWGLALPIIIFFLIVMAYIGVRKDEKLVRSLDRIR